MINFDSVITENTKVHRPNFYFRNLKTNPLLNLMNYQLEIEKIHLYAKYPFGLRYQWLINKHEQFGLKHFKGSNAFIKQSINVNTTNKNIDD